jgi:hypothetical protein
MYTRDKLRTYLWISTTPKFQLSPERGGLQTIERLHFLSNFISFPRIGNITIAIKQEDLNPVSVYVYKTRLDTFWD